MALVQPQQVVVGRPASRRDEPQAGLSPDAAGWYPAQLPTWQPAQAVALARRASLSTTENVAHLTLTCMTAGLWVLVWFARARAVQNRWYS